MPDKVVIGNAELWHGDCLEVLGMVRGYSVISDPPYALNYTSDVGGKISNDRTRDFRRVLLKLPKACAHTGATTLAIFTRWDIWGELQRAFDYLWPACNCVVWNKNDTGRGNCNHVGNAHELVYISAPADHVMRVEGRRPTNVIEAPKVPPGTMVHPTEKPVDVMAWLVQAMCPQGETVIDPFMGSGTTGIACARFGRRFIGVELDRRHFDTACRRIEAAQAQGCLIGSAGAHEQAGLALEP